MMMEPFFVMIQIAMEELGARLIDCSGGALKFVEKSDLENLIARKTQDV
jgi:hypothetical protein